MSNITVQIDENRFNEAAPCVDQPEPRDQSVLRSADGRQLMADGPQRSRLDTALDTADVGGVTGASSEWLRCATLLGEVAKALDNAAEMDVRGSTGTSMKGAFTRSAKSVREKIERLDQGRTALLDAHAAIVTARQDRVALDADNPGMSEPGEFRPDPEKTPEENKTARGLHQGAVNDYWDRYARREAEARRIADSLDTKYADSVAVMKQIHGEPDATRGPAPEGQGPPHQARQAGQPARPRRARWTRRTGMPHEAWEPPERRHHDPTDPPTRRTRPTRRARRIPATRSTPTSRPSRVTPAASTR